MSLAKVYHILGFEQKALRAFETIVEKSDLEQKIDKERGEALIWLANHCKNEKNY